MLTPIGRTSSGIGRIRMQRIAHKASGRVARLLVAAWLAVLALYAVTGGVALAHAANLPTVTSVTPGSGPATGGTSVTIKGTLFKNVRSVKFGSTNAVSFTVKSAKSIIATSPAGAVGTVDVTVIIRGNRSSATSSADHFKLTPTVTGVSPNTGPPAGGTPVTITGSGFAVGKSATRITFRGEESEMEAVGVSCTTPTECTATAPEISPEERNSIMDVRATVNHVVSPQSSADQFIYHGLFLAGESGRIPVGHAFNGMRGSVSSGEVGCSAFVVGTMVSNGQSTVEMETAVGRFTSCPGEGENFFGDLPFSFTAVRLGDDGSATIEDPLGVRTPTGCVYEGDQMAGSFEVTGQRTPLNASLGGTLSLVAEEQPGAECAATESVSVRLEAEQTIPLVEVLG
jgi:IPT/TIG domain